MSSLLVCYRASPRAEVNWVPLSGVRREDTLEAHPGPVGFIRLIWSLSCSPYSIEAHPGAMETHPGTMEVYLFIMEAHPGALETHPGA
jgi:hypothetical protein